MRGSIALVTVLLLACDKAPAEASEPPALSAAPPAASSAPAPAASSAPAPAPPPAASSSSPGPVDAGLACGEKGLPDCPLQSWMKKVANPPVLAKDNPAVAEAFDKMVPMAPPGYTNWVSIAKDGARAARGGDLDAARAACRGCHDQYKKKYRAEHRRRAL